MSESKEVPALLVADNVGSKQRNKNKKDEKNMEKINKAVFGVIFLILKISFVIAAVALWRMPYVELMISLPLYQIVGSIIVAFLAYLELYAYFAQPASRPAKKSALDKFKLGYEAQPIK